MSRDINDSELDWTAFCYAVGELDTAAADQFELRLADDHAAREALARAVELKEVVAAAESQAPNLVTPAAAARADWSQRFSWMAIGGLASALVALLWSGVVGPTWQTAHSRLRSGSQYQLAMAWNQTRDEFADLREVGHWNDSDDDALAGGAAADDEIADAPSWMTAAVFSVSPDSDDGRPQNENE